MAPIDTTVDHELNRKVAHKIMGWRYATVWFRSVSGPSESRVCLIDPRSYYLPDMVPDYSGEGKIEEAWKVVGKMKEKGYTVCIYQMDSGEWVTFFEGLGVCGNEVVSNGVERSICVAALEVLGE